MKIGMNGAARPLATMTANSSSGIWNAALNVSSSAVRHAVGLGQDPVADEAHDVAAEGQDRQHDRAARHEAIEQRAQAGGDGRRSCVVHPVGDAQCGPVAQCDDRRDGLRRTS